MSIESFAGTHRYTPTRVLGAGSWGRVFQAYDNQRNAFVAIKLLKRASPDALMRFKREFRALQDLVHPNLVTLYELLSDADQWFFTMELVDGKSFLDHLRGRAQVQPASTSSGAPTINDRVSAEPERESVHAPTATVDPETLVRSPTRPKNGAGPPPPLGPDGLARLRDALGQLVDGVCALHEAGKLHRDLKPTNVLVTQEGRVVVLDFGLVHELSEADDQLSKGQVVGTPAYMSPEQAGGQRLDEASDWYAVGVLLFEALTGEVPFEGPSAQMLKARRTEDAPRPSQRVPSVPDDLDALCADLLSRKKEARPTGAQLRERLSRPALARPRGAVVALHGRRSELDALRLGFTWVRERKAPALITVEAPSGLGKTALLDAFLDEVRRKGPPPILLAGSCGERESVPYKAFDGAIDALATQLATWPAAVLRPLMPKDIRSLMRLFPVLKRLESAVPEGAPDAPADPLEIRRRAFAAARALLGVLALHHTVVLALDDLHFSDDDSAALLEAVLKSPRLPPILVVATFRLGEGGPEPAVRALEDAAFGAAGARDVQLTRVVLAPLAESAARALAVAHGVPQARLDEVVREAKGSPMLLKQLASMAHEGVATVGDWAQKHSAALSPAARRLLDVVVAAGRPIERMVAWHAAGLDAELKDPLLELKAARLVASEGGDRVERLVPYQKDVAAALRAALPEAERQRLLAAMADALAASAAADFECVADWAKEAGQVLRASLAFQKAGERAEEVLAFDRAARLYERAIEGRPDADMSQLHIARARALAGAGRGKQSAAVYLKLAATANRDDALGYRQRAAEQLLYCGHVDAGLAVMSEVLAALGEPLPKSSALTKAWTLIARMRVELHGLKWQVKPKEQWDPAQLMRTDAYWAAAKGFSLVDPIRGTGFQFTHFRHALDCGDPYRIARALAMEAGFHALLGVTHERACHQALQLLHEVLKDHPNDHTEGLSALMAGSSALGTGRFAESARHFEYAVALFKEKCPDMTWEISSSLQYLAFALQCMGEYEHMRRWMSEVRDWATARGDVYALTNFRVRVGAIVRLMEDDPKGAHHEVAAALGDFSHAGYFAQHLWGYLGEVAALLYEGRHAEATARERAEWPKIRASGMLRIQFTRVLVGYSRGLVAQSTIETEKVARLLEAEGIAWAAGLGALLRASAAMREGRTAHALEQLDAGARVLDGCGAKTHAMAARRAAGELRGALTERDEADAWFRSRGIKRPDRFAAAFFSVTEGLRASGSGLRPR